MDGGEGDASGMVSQIEPKSWSGMWRQASPSWVVKDLQQGSCCPVGAWAGAQSSSS